MARNKLIHDNLQPSLVKAMQQISQSLAFHCVAWREAALPSLWLPPCAGHIKENFDVAVRDSFAVATAVTNDDSRNHPCNHSEITLH